MKRGIESTSLLHLKAIHKSKLLYDSQSACLGIEHLCGTCDQILFPVGMLMSEICGHVSMGVPSLIRGRVCNLQCNQWPESLRTGNHTLLSHLRLLQPGGPGSCIYIPQEQVAQLYPRALGFLYVVSYDSQG
jgi:hypothetical protein